MLIDGKQYRSIWYELEGDQVRVINQTRLPHRFEICSLESLADACEAIRSMKVRGAPLIGVTAAFGVYLALRENPGSLREALQSLQNTRPTAVNLRWALDRVARELTEQAPAQAPGKALQLALALAEEDVACCEAIGEHGSEVLHQTWRDRGEPGRPLQVLTHCNAGALAAVDWGTALAVIYKAAAMGVPLHVWVDETRPRNQGAALTCWELRQHGIDHTLIVDGAAGHVMRQGLVDVCVTGSDRVSACGDVCNKIGTYQVALAARDNGIPFYAALPVSTIDFSWSSACVPIPIEVRNAEEISQVAGLDADGREVRLSQYPPETAIRNYAFDVTPARLVSGIVTERGMFKAEQDSLGVLAKA